MRLLFLSDGLAPFVVGGMQQHSTILVKYMALLVDDITLMHCGKISEAPPDSAQIMEALGHPRNVVAIGAPFFDSGRLPGLCILEYVPAQIFREKESPKHGCAHCSAG